MHCLCLFLRWKTFVHVEDTNTWIPCWTPGDFPRPALGPREKSPIVRLRVMISLFPWVLHRYHICICLFECLLLFHMMSVCQGIGSPSARCEFAPSIRQVPARRDDVHGIQHLRSRLWWYSPWSLLQQAYVIGNGELYCSSPVVKNAVPPTNLWGSDRRHGVGTSRSHSVHRALVWQLRRHVGRWYEIRGGEKTQVSILIRIAIMFFLFAKCIALFYYEIFFNICKRSIAVLLILKKAFQDEKIYSFIYQLQR